MIRTERISVRVTRTEKELIQEMATNNNRSISDYIRVQLLEKIPKENIETSIKKY